MGSVVSSACSRSRRRAPRMTAWRFTIRAGTSCSCRSRTSSSARALREAPRMTPPQGLYDEFCARFPYEETEDQQTSIDAVMADLAAGRPMDRLVCGDVGFGKTEVALRAAFVAALSGRQVAIVV